MRSVATQARESFPDGRRPRGNHRMLDEAHAPPRDFPGVVGRVRVVTPDGKEHKLKKKV